MSAAKHTPGPWLRDGRTVYALETVRGLHGRTETRNRFSFQVQNTRTPDAELEAVAVLTQAAPDLLEALEALVSCRHTHGAGSDNKDTCAACGKDIRDPVHFAVGESRETDLERARAALAKARGEQ